MRKTLCHVLLALAISASAPMAWPAGWGGILRNGPVEDFNDEDMRLFLAAIKQAVEASEVSKPVEWRNADSGAGGTLVVLGKSKVQGFRRLPARSHDALLEEAKGRSLGVDDVQGPERTLEAGQRGVGIRAAAPIPARAPGSG